jgi:hypothetical protein
MRRVWEICPTSERIVQDIDHFPAALDKIIAAEGAYVLELDKRKGRRARVARAFDFHPDCAGARNANAAKYDGWMSEVPRTSPRRAPPPEISDEESADSDCSSE